MEVNWLQMSGYPPLLDIRSPKALMPESHFPFAVSCRFRGVFIKIWGAHTLLYSSLVPVCLFGCLLCAVIDQANPHTLLHVLVYLYSFGFSQEVHEKPFIGSFCNSRFLLIHIFILEKNPQWCESCGRNSSVLCTINF